MSFDANKLIADLSDSRAQVITLTASKGVLEGQVTELTAARAATVTELAAASGRVVELEAELAAAKANPQSQEQLDAAVAFLQATFSKLTVAKGGTEPSAETLPKTVTELKAKIEELTANLTAILPVGGVSKTATSMDAPKDQKVLKSAFSVR